MTEPKFVTVYHPVFPEVSEDVQASDVAEWADAGWRKTPLKPADEK